MGNTPNSRSDFGSLNVRIPGWILHAVKYTALRRDMTIVAYVIEAVIEKLWRDVTPNRYPEYRVVLHDLMKKKWEQ